MNITLDLRKMLQIPPDSGEDDAMASLTAILTSAVHDEHPPYSLQQIHESLQRQSECFLDGLTVIPLLLHGSNRPFASDILDLAGSQCSAKEVVLSTQEALEKLLADLQSEDSDEEDASSSHPRRLILAVKLYTSAIPRLQFRKKSASATIGPLFDDVKVVLQHIGNRCKTEEGRELLAAISGLAQKTLSWCKMQSGSTLEEQRRYNTVLQELIDATILSLTRFVDSSLCARVFRSKFPRLGSLEQLNEGWEEGEAAIHELLRARNLLERTTASPSDVDLVVCAYTEENSTSFDHRSLSFLMPVITACLQTNIHLEETLAVLLMAMTNPSRGAISEETILMPLASLLPAVTSHQPDAQLRHYAYRILSLLLQRSASLTRMSILRELLSDGSLPIQMRAATIGLVKEALLDGIARSDSVFASPRFLQAFGPTLFRIPDGFVVSNDETMEAEAARLTEVLTLYYICLIRDKTNKTGIRDRDNLRNVEQALLTPLKKLLAQAQEDNVVSAAPLMTALERVNEAL